MQKQRNLFEKMDTFMECYRHQYTDHFKSEFPYGSAQSFNEGAINVGVTEIRHVTRGGGR